VKVGIVQGGVRARVVERQIVRHLTHLIPYLTPSPVTTLIHPFLPLYAFLQPDSLTLRAILPPRRPPPWPTSSSSSSLLPLRLYPSHPPFLSHDGPRRAAASKALDYLPLISARVAHLLPRLPRLPRPKDRPPPLSPLSHSPRAVSSFVFHLSSCRFLPSSYHLRQCSTRVSSVSSFCSQAAPPRSLLTL